MLDWISILLIIGTHLTAYGSIVPSKLIKTQDANQHSCLGKKLPYCVKNASLILMTEFIVTVYEN